MKSHVSTLREIAECVIRDVFARCAVKKSATRDIITMVSRTEHEGLSFLTITLPTFGEDFEKSLAAGSIDSTHFRSFRKCGLIPAFLQGIVSRVFDADTGRILNEPDHLAVEGIRQIAYTFKKVKLPCTPERVAKAFTGYIQDESDLSTPVLQEDVSAFENVCNVVWDWLPLSGLLRPFEWLPKHGPGATAERISGNGKYRIHNWHDRLEPYFPVDQYAFGTLSALDSQEFENVTIVSPDSEQPVRVITVPKTLKSPRIIAIEPVCMQYAQQALSLQLTKALEANRLTRGHVNFTSQQINQSLALTSSKSGQMATLDLSSASDRVPRALALTMFNSHPDLRDAIDACRSKKAQLPNGDIIHLEKFASMGSALCFPVESMYFYTVCVGALLVSRDLPVTARNIFKVSRDVYVYGDDIVVPTDEAATVISHLQKYKCKVNLRKSFWSGSFRESCGMDAFSGTVVTPTYLRELPPNDRRSSSALVSWVATANLFNKRGYFATASYLFDRCERILGRLPNIGEQCSGLGRIVEGNSYSIERWNNKLHVSEIRAWIPKPVYRSDELENYAALMKCLLNLERRSSSGVVTGDTKHLHRTVRRGAVALKRLWVRPY